MENVAKETRAALVNALAKAGLNPRTTPPKNSFDEYVFIGENTPFIEASEHVYGVNVHYELLAFPKASLDPVEQVKRADILTGKIMGALWETMDITCEGYSTITGADDKPRTVTRFNVTLTYQ